MAKKKKTPFKYEVVGRHKFFLATNKKDAQKAKNEIERLTGCPAKIKKLGKVA